MVQTVSKSLQSATVAEKFFSVEAYYSFEEKSIHKNEYHNGKIIRMAGAKLKHNKLALQVGRLILDFVLKNKLNYQVSGSDTKIRIESLNKIVYPDAVVICSPTEFYKGREDTITNPIIVVEVLSLSTQNHDQTTKFEMYRTIESFKGYVLINQDVERVSVWTKQPDNKWILEDYNGVTATAIIAALNFCPISLEELYIVV